MNPNDSANNSLANSTESLFVSPPTSPLASQKKDADAIATQNLKVTTSPQSEVRFVTTQTNFPASSSDTSVLSGGAGKPISDGSAESAEKPSNQEKMKIPSDE